MSRLVNKCKTKGIVDTEHLGGRPKKSTSHTYCNVIRYVEIQFANWNSIWR